MSPALVLLLNFAATLYMTGVIWFVQLVHYPLFGGVGADHFREYEADHARLTTWVVMPPMILELATAFVLLRWRPSAMPEWSAWVAAALVLIIWLSTFLLQVPQHNVLSRGFDERAHQLLVQTNWVRTVAWSLRTILLTWIVCAILRSHEGTIEP